MMKVLNDIFVALAFRKGSCLSSSRNREKDILSQCFIGSEWRTHWKVGFIFDDDVSEFHSMRRSIFGICSHIRNNWLLWACPREENTFDVQNSNIAFWNVSTHDRPPPPDNWKPWNFHYFMSILFGVNITAITATAKTRLGWNFSQKVIRWDRKWCS